MTNARDTHLWSMARHDYQQGLNVGLLCQGYNIPRSTFFARAKREGWLRADAEREAERDGDLTATPGEAPPCREMAQLALNHAAEAMFKGDLAAAERWTRLARRYRDLTVEETPRVSCWKELVLLDRQAAQAAEMAAAQTVVAKTVAAETVAAETDPDPSPILPEPEDAVRSMPSEGELDSPARPAAPPQSRRRRWDVDDITAIMPKIEAIMARSPALMQTWRRMQDEDRASGLGAQTLGDPSLDDPGLDDP